MNYTELDWRWAILLGVVLRDGLLDAVTDRSRAPDEVAGELGLDARTVYVVRSALAELGVLEEGGEGFGLREEPRAALVERDDPEYVGGSVEHRFELIGSWSRLGTVLRSGEPVEERISSDLSGTATFIQAMRQGAHAGAEGVAGAVIPRLSRGARILDVGGGPATLPADAPLAQGLARDVGIRAANKNG